MSFYSDTDSDSSKLSETTKEIMDTDELNTFIMCEDYIIQQIKLFLHEKIDMELQNKIYSYMIPVNIMIKSDTVYKMYKNLTSDTIITSVQYKDNLLLRAMNLIRFESKNVIQYEIHTFDVDDDYNHIDYLLLKSLP